MNVIAELKQKRAAIVVKQRGIVDKADEEKRGLTAEETQEYENLNVEFDSLSAQIAKAEKEESIRSQVKDRVGLLDDGKQDRNFRDDLNEGGGPALGTDEYRGAYDHYLRQGKSGLFADEVRALQVGTDSEGGYTVPDEFNKKLIEALYDVNVMRGICTVISSSNGTMDIPVVASQGVAAWTAEEAAYNESDDVFGLTTLGAHKLTRIIKVSEELLNDSAFNLEAYLAGSFANSFGGAEETAFVSGNGTGKPTGIVTSAETGVTTAAASAIASDEILGLYHSLKRQYRGKAKFMMNDAVALAVRKLKNTDGQYIWQPGLQANEPDMLLGKPVVISHDMDATIEASAKSILFADFSYYWIAERTGRTFQRLNELYAASGQIGFKASQRVDGKLVLAEAAKLLIQKS